MKNGLKTTLFAFAASIAGISSSYAAAPVISGLPDIIIGDKEVMDGGGSDSNFFIFTNAFRFQDHVTDADSNVSDLIWTFTEGDMAAGGASTSNYFTVNNKGPIANGVVAEANLSNEYHLPANDVAGAEVWASIRNVIYSPGLDSGPFPEPSTLGASVVASHEAGKLVTFHVSDGEKFDSAAVVVKTIDNANDLATFPTSSYENRQTDTFSTGSLGWTPTGGNTSTVSTSYNAANTALYATVTAGSGNRIIAWLENQANGDVSGVPHLLFKDVAPGKLIRAKLHVFATGQPSADKNLIPNMRARLGSRFAFAKVLEILHSTPADPDGTNTAIDLAPSSNPAAPTVHRMDLVRPDLPYFNTVAGQLEGVQRYFEAFSTAQEPAQVGTLALTESSLGVYDLALASTDPSVLKKEYLAADLNNSASRYYNFRQLRRGDLQLLAMNDNGNNAGGTFGGVTWTGIPAGEMTISNSGAMTISTVNTADTKIAVAVIDFLQGTVADANNHAGRVRLGTDMTYAVRFIATASGASSDNAMIRFRVRAAKFNYGSRLEVGNPWNLGAGRDTTRVSNLIAIQALPGTGGFAGPFDVIMNSPLTTGRSVTSLENEPGPGVPLPAGRTASSRRDVYPAVDIIDSLGGSYFFAGTNDPQEKGNVSISKIEIREFPLEQD